MPEDFPFQRLQTSFFLCYFLFLLSTLLQQHDIVFHSPSGVQDWWGQTVVTLLFLPWTKYIILHGSTSG
jgi:uncharacterized membrane protein